MKKKTNPSHPLMNAPVQAYTGMSNISLPLCQHHGKTTGGFTRAWIPRSWVFKNEPFLTFNKPNIKPFNGLVFVRSVAGP